MSPKKDTQKSARSTTAIGKTSTGFTDEERVAMKERVQELKATARRGPRADKADGESAVLAMSAIWTVWRHGVPRIRLESPVATATPMSNKGRIGWYLDG